jgi:branched-chain amino acid transport system substrate-binding protein
MGKRRIRIGVGAALAAAFLAVAAAQAGRTAGGTITIGGSWDKSGPTVVNQAPVLHAMQAYFRMVNDAGGINGDKIVMIEKDDQFNPAKELEIVKSLINDDHVPLIVGMGGSSGLPSVIPVLNSTHTVGYTAQGTLKDLSDPFQPWIFEGNCNYADQADVSLGYQMAHFKLKNLKGVKVGIAGIGVASGQEWIDALTAHVKSLGGTPVVQTLPSVIVNADVQAQAFADAKVKFILLHHGNPGGIAMLKSLDKYNFQVPVSGSYGVTQPLVYTSSPYNAAKNFVGVNCVSPPNFVKSKKGKLALATGRKYGYPEAELAQANWALGWVQAQVVVQALRNAKGTYTSDAIRRGFEKIKNLDTGDLSPRITLSSRCHMAIRQVRPYFYDFKKNDMLPVGSYAQWSKFITNAQAAPGTCGKKG